MLQGEKPFGSWRESEIDTFSKIAKGQLHLSPTISPDAADLITKVTQLEQIYSISPLLSFELTVLVC